MSIYTENENWFFVLFYWFEYFFSYGLKTYFIHVFVEILNFVMFAFKLWLKRIELLRSEVIDFLYAKHFQLHIILS